MANNADPHSVTSTGKNCRQPCEVAAVALTPKDDVDGASYWCNDSGDSQCSRCLSAAAAAGSVSRYRRQ